MGAVPIDPGPIDQLTDRTSIPEYLREPHTLDVVTDPMHAGMRRPESEGIDRPTGGVQGVTNAAPPHAHAAVRPQTLKINQGNFGPASAIARPPEVAIAPASPPSAQDSGQRPVGAATSRPATAAASSMSAKAPPPPRRHEEPAASEDDDEVPTAFFVHSSPMTYDPAGPPTSGEQPAPAESRIDYGSGQTDSDEPPTAIHPSALQPDIPRSGRVPQVQLPADVLAAMGRGPSGPMSQRTMLGMPPAPAGPGMQGLAPGSGSSPGSGRSQPMALRQYPHPSSGSMPQAAGSLQTTRQSHPYAGGPASRTATGAEAYPAAIAASGPASIRMVAQAQVVYPGMPGADGSQPALSTPFHTPSRTPGDTRAGRLDSDIAPMWMQVLAVASLVSAVVVLTIFGWMVTQRF